MMSKNLAKRSKNEAFSSIRKSNFLWEIVPTRHFFATHSLEPGIKLLKGITFPVFPAFGSNMNLADNGLKH
jgi:hypothetical protein